ncbi:MAG: NADH-quinone oxidoreductase subunit NuoF [Lentisphaeria bacterium]|jgi:NADH-quinone oxidoreductase subunit F/NADP-reducing hydrogenase subunit HndC
MSRLATRYDLTALARKLAAGPGAGAPPVQVFVGMSTCGLASGAGAVYEAMAKALAARKLANVTLVKAGCVGLCYAEPTVEVQVAGQPIVTLGNVTPERGEELVAELAAGGKIAGAISEGDAIFKKQVRIALRHCGRLDPEKVEDYLRDGGYQTLAKALFDQKPEELIQTMKDSGLRGRGGAGFPTGLKWEAARKAANTPKYIVCNADEGDPGAFMDRSVLEGDPHCVLEAMALAGYAIGARFGYIYCRAEYPLAVKRLEIAIGQARQLGLLGANILGSGFDFDIEVKLGAGAFVCGEETSLIHSIEGKRGEPTVKPPFPAESGLWGKSTTVNNVETLACVVPILEKGAAWFRGIGTPKCPGTKVFALAGDVKNVGLAEVPMGITIHEVLEEIGGGSRDGKPIKAVQTGGPSGGCIPASKFDTPIEYETLASLGSIMGSGGLIVMGADTSMVKIAHFYLQFTCDESCGKCTPCRVGNKRLLEILDRLLKGEGKPEDLEKLQELGNVIKDTALCGLGQTSPNPVLSTLHWFRGEYEECLKKGPKAVTYRIVAEKCVGCRACAKVCPVSCIDGKLKKPHVIRQEECIHCGACFSACKFDAIVRE